MGYEAERIGIQNWLQSQSFFGMSPFALDGETITLVTGAGMLSLIPGRARRGSTGAPGANLHMYAGVAMITVVHDTASQCKTICDLVVEAMTNLKIDGTGATATPAASTVIDFSYQGQAPYLASSLPETPYHRSVVNAPFVRIERK